MPCAIEKVNGVISKTTVTGIASVISSQSTDFKFCSINTATYKIAPAVAYVGTICASGAKNIISKKQIPTTTAVKPVRPPTDTPATDSIYDVVVDVPSIAPAIVAELSALSARPKRGMLPFSSAKPAF